MTGTPIPPPRLDVTYQAAPGHRAACYAAVSQVLLNALEEGVPPAVAMAVTTAPGEFSYAAAGGWASLGGESAAAVPANAVPANAVPANAVPANAVPANAGTLFDIASLTKVVATVPLALLLCQRGAWRLDDPVARWLPGAPASPVTIGQCLTHTAGLVPHRQFYASGDSPAAIRQAVQAELADAAGGPVCYSDLGFMLLGWAIERCAGEPLDELVSREILGPLGMASTCYRPAVRRNWIAATEADGDQRLVPGLVWGSVHDGNAFALGGVSGHAGLFSTAGDLSRFGAALLAPERHPVLSAESIALMTRQQAVSGDDVRGIGWRLRPGGVRWGRWPAGTIWHTGFTGTSLLISPPAGMAVVLLTNGVHPVRRLDQIADLRATIHRAVLRAARG